MASMRRFALMFSAAAVSVLTNLGNYAIRQVVVYEVGRTVYEGAAYVHQGAGYVRSRVVPMVSTACCLFLVSTVIVCSTKRAASTMMCGYHAVQ